MAQIVAQRRHAARHRQAPVTAHSRDSKFSPHDYKEVKQAGKNVRILMGVPKVRDPRNLTELLTLRPQFVSYLIAIYSTAHPAVPELQDRMKLPIGTDQSGELGRRKNGSSLCQR